MAPQQLVTQVASYCTLEQSTASSSSSSARTLIVAGTVACGFLLCLPLIAPSAGASLFATSGQHTTSMQTTTLATGQQVPRARLSSVMPPRMPSSVVAASREDGALPNGSMAGSQPLGLAPLLGAAALVLLLPFASFFLRRNPSPRPSGPANDPLDVEKFAAYQNLAMASVTSTTEAEAVDSAADLLALKRRILQIAALTDRGQRHLKLVSGAMADRAESMTALIQELVERHPCRITQEAVAGNWELVWSSVELFRSSPFFLAIEEAFNDKEKSELFFKLHLLQVGSWGVSTIGEVSQRIDFEKQTLESDFDTTIFGLTVIPIVGWFKLLPTFGGRVVTEAKNLKLEGDKLTMELERTQIQEAPGIPFMPLVGGAVKDRWVPVNAVWQLLPWNKAKPTCSVRLVYVDDDMRIVEDPAGGLFVYMRPLQK